jgi:glycosyltransferase involved in cell wall biosynthesis
VGVVTPQLRRYGGSEIYLLECLSRWQADLDVTVYTPELGRRLLEEFGVGPDVAAVRLPSLPIAAGRQRLLHDSVLHPQLWERTLGAHDVYFLYLVPTQMIRRRPAVWFAAEPMRMIYDLRHHSHALNGDVDVHFYPRHDYDRIAQAELDVLLSLIETVDLPACDRLATNSRAMAGYLMSVYGREVDRVVHPGVDLSVAPTPPPGTRTVLVVSRLWKHKRVDLAVRALALLPRARLVIAGHGPERRALASLARRLGVGGRVRFAGAVPQAELRRLYARSTVCLYPAIREPFGMVPLEAAAAGRPVVATAGGGWSEVLGDAARVVAPRAGDVARALAPILDDPVVAARLGRRARRAVEPCSWDRTAEALLELFHEAAGAQSGGGRPRAPDRTPLLGAHYYAWYRAGKTREHWDEDPDYTAVADLPLGGPYSSTRTSVLRRHLRMAAENGLDFLVVNWQVDHGGVSRTEREATRKLFRLVEDEGWPVRLSVLLALQSEDWPTVGGAVHDVVETLAPSPAYQRHGGRPLLWWFVNGPFLGHFFYDHARLAEATSGCAPVAAAGMAYSRFLPRLLREYFHGWCVYSPLQVASARRREEVWRESYRAVEDDGGRVRVVSISPGYDDTPLTSAQRKGTSHRVVPRRGTRTYEAMQRFALDLRPAPHLVVVTSFNEFHENTHIEPSRALGDAHLTSTREFARRLKRRAVAGRGGAAGARDATARAPGVRDPEAAAAGRAGAGGGPEDHGQGPPTRAHARRPKGAPR